MALRIEKVSASTGEVVTPALDGRTAMSKFLYLEAGLPLASEAPKEVIAQPQVSSIATRPVAMVVPVAMSAAER